MPLESWWPRAIGKDTRNWNLQLYLITAVISTCISRTHQHSSFLFFFHDLALKTKGQAEAQRSTKYNMSLGATRCDLCYSHVTLTHTHSQTSQMSGERLWPRTNSSVSFAIRIREPPPGSLDGSKKETLHWMTCQKRHMAAAQGINAYVYSFGCRCWH